MLRIAVCLLLAATALAVPGVNFRFSEKELQRYFGVDSHEKAPEYEIVYPEFVSAEGKRSVGRSAIADSSIDVQVDAFGETLHMTLEHDDSGFEPGLEAEYVTNEGIIKVPVRTDCIYTGKVVGEPSSLVSASACIGLIAVIYHASGPTSIEPLDDEYANKRDIGRGLPHVAYKSMPDNGASCPVTADSVYAQFQELKSNGDQDEDIDPEATKYLELAFIGDYNLVKTKGGGSATNTITHMTTLFNAVKNLLQKSSLSGTSLVPKLTYTRVFTEKEYKSGLYFDTVGWKNLIKAADWQNNNKFPSSDSRHWDNAAVLTGLRMDFSRTAGIAYNSQCGNKYAVSVSTFTTLAMTTNTVAHEIGHNMGMKHDNEDNTCPSTGFIMAPIAVEGTDEWSSCSKNYYNDFIGNHTCYNDS